MRLIVLFSLFISTSGICQTTYSSTPDSIFNFENEWSIPWWNADYEQVFTNEANEIDSLNLTTEVCPNQECDTLFFGDFTFPILDSISSMNLEFTKSRDETSNVSDLYLAFTFEGEILSENYADTTNWATTDSTHIYEISTEIFDDLGSGIINSESFGFLFASTLSSQWCMNIFINQVKLNIESSTNVNIGELAASKISLYPNPTKGQINFKLGLTNTASITITNSLGQLVKSIDNIGSEIYSIELAEPQGLYFAKIKTNQKSETFKIIIN